MSYLEESFVKAPRLGPVVKDDLSLLDAMLAAMQDKDDVFKPAQYWLYNNRFQDAYVRQHGIADFRAPEATIMREFGTANSMLNLAWQGVERHPVTRLSRLVPSLARILGVNRAKLVAKEMFITEQKHMKALLLGAQAGPCGAYLDRVGDSLAGNPSLALKHGEHFFTESFFGYFYQFGYIKPFVGDLAGKTVMEIGGGYGGLAEIMLKHDPAMNYIIVDIPHTAYVSTQYLKAVFPGQVLDYRDVEKNGIEFTNGKRIAVICPWQLQKAAGKAEVFLNFQSFQEMSSAIISEYKDFISSHSNTKLVIGVKEESHVRAANEESKGVDEVLDASVIRNIFSEFTLDRDCLTDLPPHYDSLYRIMFLRR